MLFALGCAATRQAQLQDADFRLRGRIGLKEPSAGVREGLAPRMKQSSAGEREGLAPRMEEPSAGVREGLAPRMKEPSAGGARGGSPPRKKEPSDEAHGERPRRRAFSTSFDWQQAGERFRIEFWGAFGQGRALLFGDDAAASLRDARGNVTSGVDIDALMEQTLGWAVPVAALRHWVRGRVDPSLAAAAEQRDGEGNLVRFEQSGWTIRLSRWRQTAIGAAPGRVVAERAGRVVTVICKEWRLD